MFKDTRGGLERTLVEERAFILMALLRAEVAGLVAVGLMQLQDHFRVAPFPTVVLVAMGGQELEKL
jgi:hypothetical protein